VDSMTITCFREDSNASLERPELTLTNSRSDLKGLSIGSFTVAVAAAYGMARGIARGLSSLRRTKNVS
jgi:hypothetical protein